MIIRSLRRFVRVDAPRSTSGSLIKNPDKILMLNFYLLLI